MLKFLNAINIGSESWIKLYKSNYNCKIHFVLKKLIQSTWTIGNKRTRVYKYIGNIDCNNTLPLPCNCYEDDIEAVLFPGEDWNRTTNKDSFGDLNSHWTEEYIEAFKHNTNILYGHGHFAKF